MLSTNTTESPKSDPTTNLDWALKYASMGLRVFPLQPGTKIPMTAHGVKDATDDPALIKEWWTRTPDAGIGLAARAEKVGDACFLEFDQKPTLTDWAKNEGQPIPETRVHQFGRQGRSRITSSRTPRNLWRWATATARRRARMVLVPRSEPLHRRAAINPSRQRQAVHRVELDIEPTPIPDWVVDAYRAERNQGAGVCRRHAPSCTRISTSTRFCDWIPAELGDEDGSWYAFQECPVAGRRHKGQGVRGCALYYDGGTLGFKCHAAECPSNADRKPGQSGISYLRQLLERKSTARTPV